MPVRSLAIVVFPILLVGVAAAQAPPTPDARRAELERQLTDEVNEQLRDARRKVVANAAFHAAERRLPGCGDELRKALGRLAAARPAKYDLSWQRTVTSVLDALRETRTAVPDDELAPFVPMPGAVAPLLDRKGSDALLLRALRESSPGGDMWCACGTVLTARRDAEFVADLVRMPTYLQVEVGDTEAVSDALPDLRGGGVGCSFDFEPKGWPPTPRYVFLPQPLPPRDDETPVDVVGLVVVRRWLKDTAGQCHWSAFDQIHPTREQWLRHLLTLAPRDAVPSTFRSFAIRWRDADALRTAIDARRRSLVQEARALAAACVAKGLLPADALADWRPTVELDVLDLRADQSVPLPEVR